MLSRPRSGASSVRDLSPPLLLGDVTLADVPFVSAEFPAHFRIDYVRVYQKSGQKNVGCDPKNYR